MRDGEQHGTEANAEGGLFAAGRAFSARVARDGALARRAPRTDPSMSDLERKTLGASDASDADAATTNAPAGPASPPAASLVGAVSPQGPVIDDPDWAAADYPDIAVAANPPPSSPAPGVGGAAARGLLDGRALALGCAIFGLGLVAGAAVEGERPPQTEAAAAALTQTAARAPSLSTTVFSLATGRIDAASQAPAARIEVGVVDLFAADRPAADLGPLDTAMIPSDGARAAMVADERPRRPVYLAGSELRAALTATPLKCVVAAPSPALARAGAPPPAGSLAHPPAAAPAAASSAAFSAAATGASGGSAPTPLGADPRANAASGAQADCLEVTLYRLDDHSYLRAAPLSAGAELEINANFRLEGDAICHMTAGLSALVFGDGMTAEAATAFERLVETHYRDTPGREICHRLRLIERPNGTAAFVADAFIDGEFVASRSDPRPFELRPLALGQTR